MSPQLAEAESLVRAVVVARAAVKAVARAMVTGPRPSC